MVTESLAGSTTSGAGAHIGRYRLLGCLAQGGMGAVYRARLEAVVEGAVREVAIKLIRPELAHDAQLRAHFFDEVRLALQLSHRNIVQAFDAGESDAGLYLVMEWVDGPSLATLFNSSSLLPERKLPPAIAVHIAREVLRGLDYAHRRKGVDGKPLAIVHRDISPGNIIISREGEVKIADFGIAKSAIQARESIDGTLKGKLPYIAPEQVAPQPSSEPGGKPSTVGPPTDIYALGAVLYEMLSGLRPIAVEHPLAALAKIMMGEVVPLQELEPDLPASLAAVVGKAMAAESAHRYPNAEAMADALHAAFPDADARSTESALRALVAEVPAAALRAVPLAAEHHDPPGATRVLSQRPAPDDATLPSPSVGPLHALQPVREAPTQVLSPFTPTSDVGSPRLSRLPRGLALALAAVVLGVVGLFFSLNAFDWTGRGGGPEAPGPAAGASAPVAPASGSVPVVPPPAAQAPMAAEGLNEDAPVGESQAADAPNRAAATGPAQRPRRRATASARSTEERRPTGEQGFLSVNSVPWSEVTIDGKTAGQTPLLRYALPPGRYRVVAKNPVTGASAQRTVRIVPGEDARLSLSLAAP